MGDHIFLDTGYIIAFFNKEDGYHSQARKLIRNTLKKYPSVRFYYSDYIFDEIITLMKSRKVPALEVIDVGESVLNSHIWTMVKITEEIFQKTWLQIKQYSDKEWSFTDVSSFVIMAEFKINYYLSFDEHFSQNPNITAWTI